MALTYTYLVAWWKIDTSGQPGICGAGWHEFTSPKKFLNKADLDAEAAVIKTNESGGVNEIFPIIRVKRISQSAF